VTSNGKLIRGLQSSYRRNGTLNLFAALEVATGKVHGKVTDKTQKTKVGFLAFMDSLLRNLPAAEEYHVILDNHSIYKCQEAWLEKNPNVFFYYTPTGASWMNMVEIWLGILKNKSLNGASFSNTESLGEHIIKFIEVYNETAKLFVWKKKEVKNGQFTNNVRNFCN
jgi:transposase